MICAYEPCGREFTPLPKNRNRQLYCCGNHRREAWKRRNEFYSRPDQIEKRKPRQRRYWHQADGGYIRRRKRTLAQQRARVLEQLAEVTSDQP